MQPAEADEPEDPRLAEAGEDTRKAAMGAALADNPAAFALVMRYQNQANRDYFRAMKHLELLRRGKAGYLPPDQHPAQSNRRIGTQAAGERNEANSGRRKAAAASCGEPNEPKCRGYCSAIRGYRHWQRAASQSQRRWKSTKPTGLFL